MGMVSECCCKEVYTVEPLFKGHSGTQHFVPLIEVSFIQRLTMYFTFNLLISTI